MKWISHPSKAVWRTWPTGFFARGLRPSHNLMELDAGTSATLSAVQSQMEMPVLARIQSALDSDLFTCLDNVIEEKIQLLAKTNWGEYMPHLSTFLSAKTVHELIEANLA